jgi:hypothetical protein
MLNFTFLDSGQGDKISEFNGSKRSPKLICSFLSSVSAILFVIVSKYSHFANFSKDCY